MTGPDPEIAAMEAVVEFAEATDDTGKRRLVEWFVSRYFPEFSIVEIHQKPDEPPLKFGPREDRP